jgi:hypothetical protein
MRLFEQVAPDGVMKSSSVAYSAPNLGTEEDSMKREYGTHPEDPVSQPDPGSLSRSNTRGLSRQWPADRGDVGSDTQRPSDGHALEYLGGASSAGTSFGVPE